MNIKDIKEMHNYGGASVITNKADNTFTVVIYDDFFKWAGNPKYTSSGLTQGQKNVHWLHEELNKFLDAQWGDSEK